MHIVPVLIFPFYFYLTLNDVHFPLDIFPRTFSHRTIPVWTIPAAFYMTWDISPHHAVTLSVMRITPIIGKGKVKRTCIAPFVKLQRKALRYGSHRVAPANYTIPASTLRTFARWRHLNGRHMIQLATHLSTPEG